MDKIRLHLQVNGEAREALAPVHHTLLEVLREELGLSGTKHGCELGECGTCAVLLDGQLVLSCLTLPIECEGRAIRTVEAMAVDGRLHPLQQAVIDEQAVQCGYCYNGQIIKGAELLSKNPRPTVEQIRTAMNGHLCRCGTYPRMIKAIQRASRAMASATSGGSRRIVMLLTPVEGTEQTDPWMPPMRPSIWIPGP